jgi:CRP-like cAMP-binding protein
MVLKNIPGFTHLTKKTLERLTFFMSEIKMIKESYLFKEGEPIKGLYLIKDGQYEISKKFKKQLNQKYNGKAFPVEMKKDIKF